MAIYHADTTPSFIIIIVIIINNNLLSAAEIQTRAGPCTFATYTDIELKIKSLQMHRWQL